MLLSLYTVLIAKLTLRPADAEERAFGVLDRVMTRVSDGRLDWSQTEVLANIALFVPAGFLLAITVGRAWASILLCVLASACIEVAQHRYLPSRFATIDDVQHNGLGGAIGALLAAPLALALRLRARRLSRLAPPALISP